jgi:hypothetical protein
MYRTPHPGPDSINLKPQTLNATLNLEPYSPIPDPKESAPSSSTPARRTQALRRLRTARRTSPPQRSVQYRFKG